jgi:hypothetical protein
MLHSAYGCAKRSGNSPGHPEVEEANSPPRCASFTEGDPRGLETNPKKNAVIHQVATGSFQISASHPTVGPR